MCKQTLHPFRQAEFRSRKVWRKILLERTFPMLRVRTAYPRPCCTCTLSPGSFRTFTFTPPGHAGKREDSVCLPSQPWLSVLVLFSLNCVQRTFLFSTERETGRCNEPRASMEHQCGWFSDIFAPETMQPRVFLLFVSLALWVLYIHSHSRPFSTCHTSYIGHELVLVTSNRHW